MIKRNVFNNIGGFDKNMFLYFEESDLFKRLKDNNYRLFIIPKAKVIHIWTKILKPNPLLKKYFSESRFYYFKKHYGLTWALFIEVLARFSKYEFIMFIMVLISIILHFYRFGDNALFHGEVGLNYIELKNYVENHQLPLVGPPTGHGWISLGPLFYWMLTPLYLFGRVDPLVIAFLFSVIGIVIIIENYIFIKHLFNKNIALLSSAIISFSPIWLQVARESRFYFLVVPFFYPYLYFLIKALKGNGKYLFFTFLFIGIMLNFHLSVLILLLPTIFLIFLNRKSFVLNDYLKAGLGLFIPNIPFLIVNLQNKFIPILKTAIWIPYRIAGFIGLYPKNTVNETVLTGNFFTFTSFISKQLIFYDFLPMKLAGLTFIIYWLIKYVIMLKKKDNNVIFVLLTLFYFSLISLFIHGNPPPHYFMPIFATPPILIAYLFDSWINRKGFRMVIITVFLLFLVNIPFYFSSQWFYLPENAKSGYIKYQNQKAVAQTIINDAKTKTYELKRVGAFDFYGDNYAQNYQYLLWMNGNEPVKKADIRYTIYEDTSNISYLNNSVIVGKVDNIIISKEILK
jgi:4-amino-4-deoxy-L-arabinose transferase-like glycosyltransferase